MNKNLFDSMQKQLNPSPEVRAALSERLAQSSKRRTPVRKYAAVAACAALVIGGFSVYSLYQDHAKWMLPTKNILHDAQVQHLHSYVTVEELTTVDTGAFIEESGMEDLYHPAILDQGSGAPNTGALPRREDAPKDIPVQEGAEDYQALMAHFNGALPDWYGGAYLDTAGRLLVLLVTGQDPGDKSLELRVQEWTGSDSVRFGSAKYSLNHLKGLMGQLNQLPDADLKYSDVMAGWGIDEEHNRIELTLTQVYDPILSALAELDPEDDAIYVQVGQQAAAYAGVEESVIPGGIAVPDEDQDLIAYEPYYDGSDYDLERLPEELPEEKRPAITVQSVPEEEEMDPLAATTYDVETGKVTVRPDPYGDSGRNAPGVE